MAEGREGQVAVIFWSRRTGEDEPGYAVAAARMDALAAAQPGYRGVQDAHGADGTGVTVSYWADEAAARAWRGHPEHAAIREAGRARWYEAYTVAVARVERDYAWHRSEQGDGSPLLASPAQAGAQSGAEAWAPASAGEAADAVDGKTPDGRP